eukprot:gnl/TRDRNA2_/TRDRNA2_177063_c1_seq4.p2 gnl/TRDRNA2_/TRDRNA2_177063_c1~~gnl/TRDRNA2_/TRDRNA2_177063_c1_seq4.p2  ORF type:complete len:148 (-),score=11.75 gnl/TRDRNA2_/TRDRNA2_177063_c1_seq4:34-477(-)
MTRKTLNQEKREGAWHWTEQAQQPASEPMAWRDCLRAKRPKAQNLEAGTRTEEARAWTESPEPASTTKGKASGRQTAWILAALLIGLPLVLLVFGHWLAWIAVAALAPQIIVFCVRSLAYTDGSSSSDEESSTSYVDSDGVKQKIIQ